MLQRAKWALDEDELNTLKDRASYYGLDKSAKFKEFKAKYLDAAKDKGYNNKIISVPMNSSTDPCYNDLFQRLEYIDIEYKPVSNLPTRPTEAEIIASIAGRDLTKGSCASLSLTYIGRKQGWDVLDFRGGESTHFFSQAKKLSTLSQAEGMVTLAGKGADNLSFAKSLLKQCQNGKEYLLASGKHAAIVRRTDQGVLQYLELQTEDENGWHNFKYDTLKERFGCSSTRKNKFGENNSKFDFMIDIEASDFSTNEYKSLLGYINTGVDKQQKGAGGFAK